MACRTKHAVALRRAGLCLVTLRHSCLALLLILGTSSAGAGAVERGVLIREANIFISPDIHAQYLGAPLERGSEVAILGTDAAGWVHVEPMSKSISGWMQDKGLVRASTPSGDRILYGAAANAEDEASRQRGMRGEAAAKGAQRLYRMTAEYFPKSDLAAEAFYRAADIAWQLQRREVMARPSVRQRDPKLRAQIEEDAMREVIKKYPHSRWADLAAYHLLDNKVCGDWEGQSKCPDKEAELYQKYAEGHPQSPVAAEALYNAASRRAALIEIYKTENQPNKSVESKARALALLQRIATQYGQQGDWAARAQALALLVEQGVPTYGRGAVE